MGEFPLISTNAWFFCHPNHGLRCLHWFSHNCLFWVHAPWSGREGGGNNEVSMRVSVEKVHGGVLTGKIHLSGVFQRSSQYCLSLHCFNWRHVHDTSIWQDLMQPLRIALQKNANTKENVHCWTKEANYTLTVGKRCWKIYDCVLGKVCKSIYSDATIDIPGRYYEWLSPFYLACIFQVLRFEHISLYN